MFVSITQNSVGYVKAITHYNADNDNDDDDIMVLFQVICWLWIYEIELTFQEQDTSMIPFLMHNLSFYLSDNKKEDSRIDISEEEDMFKLDVL